MKFAIVCALAAVLLRWQVAVAGGMRAPSPLDKPIKNHRPLIGILVRYPASMSGKPMQRVS